MSQAAVRAALLLAIAVSAAAVVFIGPAGATEGFAEEGDIVGAAPASNEFPGVAENEFIETCNGDPTAEGADAWVAEFPEGFVGDGMTATVTGDSAGPYNLDLAFYDVECSYISQLASDDADETGPVAPGSHFIVVSQRLGADTHICLIVGDAACGGDASPSGSSTARPTARPSGSPSRSGSASPGGGPGGSDISTTINTNRTKTDFRSPFVLSGKVDADGSCERPFHVTIRKRVLGGQRFRSLPDRAPVGKDDRWSREITSRVSASYVAQVDDSGPCDGGTSNPITVKVRAQVLVAAPDSCAAPQEITGQVRPNRRGSRVVLEHSTAEGWARVDRDRLNAKSRFVVTAPACETRYRVVWPSSDPRNARGVRAFRL